MYLFPFTYFIEKDVINGSGYMKKCRFLQPFYVHVEQGLWNQAQQLHLSNDAPLQTQPWAHLAQPTGQQEQQPGKEERRQFKQAHPNSRLGCPVSNLRATSVQEQLLSGEAGGSSERLTLPMKAAQLPLSPGQGSRAGEASPPPIPPREKIQVEVGQTNRAGVVGTREALAVL